MKFLVLVICAKDNDFYRDLESTIKNTWGNIKDDRWEVFYLHADSKIEKPFLDGNNFYSKSHEKLEAIGRKMIQAFEFFNEKYEFDYIFRTNLSSYVDLPKLAEILEQHEFTYDGVVGKHRGIQFASGAGYVISRDMVNFVINHKDQWNHSLIDDLALGKLMNQNNVFPKGILTRQTLLNINSNIDVNEYHYRCKQKNRYEDISLINKIHKMKHAN